MSWDYDAATTEYPTAVAAAAFAIQSLEDSKIMDGKKKYYGPEKSLNKTKNRISENEVGSDPEPLKSAPKPTGESSNLSFMDSDIKVPITSDQKAPEKRVQPKPSLKKKISFADDLTKNEPGVQAAQDKTPKRVPSLIRPPTPATDKDKPELTVMKPVQPQSKGPVPVPVEARKYGTTRPGPADSQADAWEKEEMTSINERYEKTWVIIENWEASKKKKARRKLETTEAELDRKRANAVKSYNSEIARIEEIAKGARAQAEKNRKNEEFKAKEKANKIRLTGKLPATCLCF